MKKDSENICQEIRKLWGNAYIKYAIYSDKGDGPNYEAALEFADRVQSKYEDWFELDVEIRAFRDKEYKDGFK